MDIYELAQTRRENSLLLEISRYAQGTAHLTKEQADRLAHDALTRIDELITSGIYTM